MLQKALASFVRHKSLCIKVLIEFVHPSIHSLLSPHPVGGLTGLEPIEAAIMWQAEYTRNGSPTHNRANKETCSPTPATNFKWTGITLITTLLHHVRDIYWINILIYAFQNAWLIEPHLWFDLCVLLFSTMFFIIIILIYSRLVIVSGKHYAISPTLSSIFALLHCIFAGGPLSLSPPGIPLSAWETNQSVSNPLPPSPFVNPSSPASPHVSQPRPRSPPSPFLHPLPHSVWADIQGRPPLWGFH